MAGETPDTSGQRKSSGTSKGSSSGKSSGDGAVRSSGEPSGESPVERAAKPADPRLAVSQQTVVEEAPERVDQPTAVFSTAALESESDSESGSGEADSGSDSESGSGEADSASEEASESDEAPEGAGEAGETKDARLRAAVAAWVAGSDGNDDSRPPEDEETAEPTEEAEEAPEEPEAAEEGAEGAEDEAEVEADSESDDGEAEAEVDGDGEDDDPADEDEDEDEDEESESDKADAEEEADAEEAADSDDSADSDDAPEPVDQPTAIFKAPQQKVDHPTAMLKLPADADKSDADKSDADKAADEDKAAADEPRPEEPKPEEPKPEEPKSEEPAAERDSERTSKFVALKPLDEPKAPKEPKGPPAPNKQDAQASSAAEGTSTAAVSAKAPAATAAAELPPEAPSVSTPERTTQQPLPPKPPLDLLAELTNRPKPPETALRTAVRRVKIWTPLVLLLVVVFAVVQSVRPLPTPTLELTADAKYTFDGDAPSLPWPTEGQAVVDVDGIGSLGTYGEEKPIPIGSVAKVMTAYLILKEHKATDELTVDKAAADHFRTGEPANESVVEVKEGDVITVEEAIKDIMLPSANNIAKLLARWDSDGDEDAFVKKMNAAAKDLGMKNTTYTDASGLDETTVSTAVDQVKLGKAAMEIPLFKKIVRMPKFDSTTSERPKDQANFNKLVPLFGVVGIKTGSTTKAGGNLLFAAEKEIDGERQLIIGAVFGQHLPPIIDTATARSKDLILRAQELLETRTVVKKGDVVGNVDDGLGGTTPVVATEDVSAVGWPGLTVDLAVGDGGETVPHTAKAGTEVGVLSVGDGDEGAVKVPVALQEDLAEPGFGAKLTRIG